LQNLRTLAHELAFLLLNLGKFACRSFTVCQAGNAHRAKSISVNRQPYPNILGCVTCSDTRKITRQYKTKSASIASYIIRILKPMAYQVPMGRAYKKPLFKGHTGI